MPDLVLISAADCLPAGARPIVLSTGVFNVLSAAEVGAVTLVGRTL